MQPCRSTRASQQGRTLIEMLVAIAIGTIILVALSAIYISTARTARQSDAVARMNEDAAVAFHILGSALYPAGYSAPQRMVLPSGAGENGAASGVADRNFIGAAVRGCDRGFANVTADFDALGCNAAGTGSGAIAVRFEGDLVNTLPVKTGGGGSAVLPSDCLSHGVAANAVSAMQDAPRYSLVESRFFVQKGSTSKTPELYCAGNGNSFVTPQALLQYVEVMQFRYGITEDANSTVVRFYAAATDVNALGGTPDSNWKRVASVRICLRMVSAVRNTAESSGSYLDCDGSLRTWDDGHQRRTYTSTFALRNRSGILLGTP